MKKLFLLLFITFPILGFTQIFEESKNYVFNNVLDSITDDYFMVPDSMRAPLVVKIRDKSNGLVVKSIVDLEDYTLSMISVTEAKLEGFKNVQSVVRVFVEHTGCCSSIRDEYYLITKKGNWIPFPQLTWYTCDWPEERPAYHFDDAKDPIVQEIQKVTEYRNDQGDHYKSVTNETYLWNGKFIVKKED